MSGGTFPIDVATYGAGIRPDKAKLTTWRPTRVSTTHSLRRIARSRGGHRFLLTLSYGKKYRAEADEIIGFLDEQDGQEGKFTIVVPGKENPRGAVAGTPKVDGAQAAGVTTVNLKNLANGVAGVFKRGDILTFASHLKVYRVTRASDSDGAGKTTIYLNCPLMTAITDGSNVAWQNVTMQVARQSDTIDEEINGGLVVSPFDVVLIEDPL